MDPEFEPAFAGLPRMETLLNVGAGDVSCDIVVHATETHLMYYMATNDAKHIVFKVSSKLGRDAQLDESCIPAEMCHSVIRWANATFKEPNVRASYRCVNDNGNEIHVPEEVMDAAVRMQDFNGVHPSGLMGYGTDRMLSRCVAMGNSEGEARMILDKCEPLEINVPHPETGMISFKLPLDNGVFPSHLEIPYPYATEGKTVNATIMMIGRRFLDCFREYSKIARDDGEASGPPEGSGIIESDRSECAVLFLSPKMLKNCGGLHTSTESIWGRTHIGISGIEVQDFTNQRLLNICEHDGSSVLMMCGCLVRNSAIYPRAHLPMMVGGVAKVVATDCNQGVRLAFILKSGDVKTLVVDTEHRTFFASNYWLEIKSHDK